MSLLGQQGVASETSTKALVKDAKSHLAVHGRCTFEASSEAPLEQEIRMPAASILSAWLILPFRAPLAGERSACSSIMLLQLGS